MRADSIHKYRNPPVKKKVSSAIFVNSRKHRTRRLQRMDCQGQIKRKIDPELEKELRLKNRRDRIKDTAMSIMLSVLLVFALLSLFYWAALK